MLNDKGSPTDCIETKPLESRSEVQQGSKVQQADNIQNEEEEAILVGIRIEKASPRHQD